MELVLARCRVLTCVRPLMRPSSCRGPVWCSRIRSQINAACSEALCCRLVPLTPSHDRCAKLLLALFRSDALATPVAYAAATGHW